MPKLKGSWDRLVAPPEELQGFVAVLKKVFFLVTVLPIAISLIIILLNFGFFNRQEVYGYSALAIGIAFTVSIPLSVLIIFLGSSRTPNVVKLEMKMADVKDLNDLVGRFLLENGYHYSIGLPERSSHRKYLISAENAIFIKHELFLVFSKYTPTNRHTQSVLELYYLPSVWEEALILQKELDGFLFKEGFSVPLEKDRKLTFF